MKKKTTSFPIGLFFALISLALSIQPAVSQQTGFEETVREVSQRIVKITGAGGFRGLEDYQSGILVSADGFILTVWSYVLDSGSIVVTLDDGQRFNAQLAGYDPKIEIALLKIDADGLPCFNIDNGIDASAGTPVLAFSNLYRVATGNEPVSVLHGQVSAVTNLDARRGTRTTTYRDRVYILDAMTNNPGAAGGAVTDAGGELIGMIGRELKDNRTGQWLNFCLPIRRVAGSVVDIREGRITLATDGEDSGDGVAEPVSVELLGIVLVPDVVNKTPAYIDRTVPGSAAADAGFRPDDLIVEINGQITPSCRDVRQRLLRIDRSTTVEMTLQRGSEFIPVQLEVR